MDLCCWSSIHLSDSFHSDIHHFRSMDIARKYRVLEGESHGNLGGIFQQALLYFFCLFVHICFLYVGSIPPPRMQLCANEGVIFGILDPENVMSNIILLKTSQHPRGWIQYIYIHIYIYDICIYTLED